ncbi:hypothetical protein LLS1_34510 [Leifsonia sp. LS1]|nr:hypothetical protein [Leifsonia sp. LS1]GIT81782.1 hypothetical protein LLS1_34510 [Leifsonia sp. LS1]
MKHWIRVLSIAVAARRGLTASVAGLMLLALALIPHRSADAS